MSDRQALRSVLRDVGTVKGLVTAELAEELVAGLETFQVIDLIAHIQYYAEIES